MANSTEQAITSANSFVKGLTSEQMANMVNNSNNDNFFMYAFIIFSFVMIVGMVSMVWIFIRKDNKKDIRQNEQYKDLLNSQSTQYKDLLQGYTKMIDQNAETNTEFRKTIADIGNVLRELTNTISRNEAMYNASDDKFSMLFKRLDNLSVEFREHQKNNNDNQKSLEMVLQELCSDIKNTTEWCKNVNVTKPKKG